MCELIYRSSWNSVASFSRKLQSLHNIQHLCSFILCNNGPFKSPEHHCLDEEHTAHHHSALIQENLKRSFSDVISMKSSKIMPHVLWKCKTRYKWTKITNPKENYQTPFFKKPVIHCPPKSTLKLKTHSAIKRSSPFAQGNNLDETEVFLMSMSRHNL